MGEGSGVTDMRMMTPTASPTTNNIHNTNTHSTQIITATPHVMDVIRTKTLKHDQERLPSSSRRKRVDTILLLIIFFGYNASIMVVIVNVITILLP